MQEQEVNTSREIKSVFFPVTPATFHAVQWIRYSGEVDIEELIAEANRNAPRIDEDDEDYDRSYDIYDYVFEILKNKVVEWIDDWVGELSNPDWYNSDDVAMYGDPNNAPETPLCLSSLFAPLALEKWEAEVDLNDVVTALLLVHEPIVRSEG